ncbi:MAG: hypothetical protein HC886_11885 [Leptolyngbyaceae cyanobacterium SM1_1_3]|nr:hypothetical protein [Leptolyngbyaceae cyanobacterium SM1_1_3]
MSLDASAVSHASSTKISPPQASHLRRQKRLTQMKRWGRFSISTVLMLAIAFSMLEAFTAARSQPEFSLPLRTQLQETLQGQQVSSKISS